MSEPMNRNRTLQIDGVTWRDSRCERPLAVQVGEVTRVAVRVVLTLLLATKWCRQLAPYFTKICHYTVPVKRFWVFLVLMVFFQIKASWTRHRNTLDFRRCSRWCTALSSYTDHLHGVQHTLKSMIPLPKRMVSSNSSEHVSVWDQSTETLSKPLFVKCLTSCHRSIEKDVK